MGKVKLYPNPTQGDLVLSVEEYADKNLSFQVMDVQGRIIHQGKINQETTAIDLTQEARSMYYLNIRKANQPVKSFKIIKK